jgi:hypothetical protein
MERNNLCPVLFFFLFTCFYLYLPIFDMLMKGAHKSRSKNVQPSSDNFIPSIANDTQFNGGIIKETPTSDQSDPTKQQTHIYTMMTRNFVFFFPHWKPKTGTNDFLVAAATPITVWDSCCAVCISLYEYSKGRM